MGIKFKAIAVAIVLFIVNISPAFAWVPVINYETEANLPPFRFTQGNYSAGFDEDLSGLIFKSEDYRIIYSNDTWTKVYDRLKNGAIDTCGLLAVSESRKKDMLFTKPVLRSFYAVYTRRSFLGPAGLKDLKNYKVGVGRGKYSEELLRKSFDIMNYFSYADIEDAVDALERGEIQVLFERQEVVNYLLTRKGLTGEIVPLITNLFPTDIAYGVKKGNPQLVEYMNKRIDELMESGVYEELYEKYFYSHSQYYNDMRKRRLERYAIIAILSIASAFIMLQLYIKYLRKKILHEQGFSKSVIESANIFIYVWNLTDSTLVKFNKYARAVTGYSEDEVLGDKWKGTIANEELLPCMECIFKDLRQGKIPPVHEVPVLCKDGRRIDVIWNNSIIFDETGAPDIAVSMGIDITERKEAELKVTESYQELESVYEELAATEEELRSQFNELQNSKESLTKSEERYRLSVEGANDGLWDYDFKTNKAFFSARCKEIIGFKNDEIKDEIPEWAKLLNPEDSKRFEESIKDHLEGSTPYYSEEYRLKTKGGSYKWVLCRGKVIFSGAGEPIRIAGSLTDIDGRKKAEAIIHNMAYYDTLTGLANRTLLYKKLDDALLQARDEAGVLGLMFMDLDNFKSINDTLGHSYGDKLLKSIAELLKGCIKKENTIARLAGDEFVFLLTGAADKNEIVNIAKSILQIFQRPVSLGNHEIFITASVGIAVYPGDGDDAQALLKNADAAMYHAKEGGRNNYKFYTEEMNTRLIKKLDLENSLRAAVINGELNVFYQPQIDINTGKVVGVEALVRWYTPHEGYIPPMSFIPTAEETGLIIPIGEFVLRRACAQNKAWQELGYPPVRVSVNISARQFQQDIVDAIKRILNETGLAPEWLALEITESAALLDFDFTISTIKKLEDMGIEVYLDDFGTGYSSLNYLNQLPIKSLKIDKSFIQDMGPGLSRDSIIKAIIYLAHSMNLKVIAEGVETEEQLSFLKERNCDGAQGYYFSKPLSAGEIEDILKRGKVF